jgi:hypothetical protein
LHFALLTCLAISRAFSEAILRDRLPGLQFPTTSILFLWIFDHTRKPKVWHELLSTGVGDTLLHISKGNAVKGAIYLGQLGLDDLLAKAILLKLCLQRVPDHQSRIPCTSQA